VKMIRLSDDFTLSLDDIRGKSAAALGIPGSGKTNTVALLIEQLLLNNYPVTVVDIEGEYWGLKEKFNVLIAGRGDQVEFPCDTDQAAALAQLSLTESVSVILDVSDFDDDERFEFLLAYFNGLWEVAGKARKPYQVVLEEAHEFIPQTGNTPVKTVLARIAKRGRKRGLGLVIVSQNSAKVEKDVLKQVPLLFLHRVVHPLDVKVYQDLIPLPTKDVETLVRSLGTGQVIILRDNQPYTVQINRRETFHAGSTPDFEGGNAPNLKRFDEGMLDRLREMAETMRPAAPDNTAAKLKAAEKTIEFLNKRIEDLERENALLKTLRVEMPAFEMPEVRVNVQSPAVAPAPVTVAQAPVRAAVVTASTSHEQISQQKARFRALMQDVGQLKPSDRKILRYLTGRDGEFYSVAILARQLGYKQKTIKDNPPVELVRLGLAVRRMERGGYVYAGRLRQYLKSQYPTLDTEELAQQIGQVK
jgi:hypothetical protein